MSISLTALTARRPRMLLPLSAVSCKKEVGKTANKSHTKGKWEGGSFVIAHLSVETQFSQQRHRVEFSSKICSPTANRHLSD